MGKYKNNRILRWAVIGLIFMAFFSGCTTTKEWKPEETDPADLMAQAMNSFEEKNFVNAVENFQKIVDRYPYSQYSVDAALRLADCYYFQREYDTAFDAYNEFQRLHPKNSNLPYVLYQMGLCHLDQTSTIDRDQYHTQQAKEHFERLVNAFPQSEYAAKAKWKIRQCYILLAGSELYVGRFYYKMKKYEAAMARFRYVLENYPDLGQYHEALEYLSKCKEKLAEQEPQKDQS